MPASLSVCMIIKNEEARLARCLESLRDVGNELVIVDTGSTDNSLQIAAQFGANVHHFAWVDDFSAARNVSLEKAAGDWILVVDADDVFDRATIPALRTCQSQSRFSAFTLTIDNHNGIRERVVRLFRRDPAVRYQGRIHEQIVPAIRRADARIGECDVRLVHDGYKEEVMLATQKLKRNEHLLLKELETQPLDPFLWFQLGKNHMAANHRDAAFQCLHQARLLLLRGDPSRASYGAELWACTARVLLAAKEHALASALCAEGQSLFPQSADLAFFEGQASLGLGDRSKARSLFQRTLEPSAIFADLSLKRLAAEVIVLL